MVPGVQVTRSHTRTVAFVFVVLLVLGAPPQGFAAGSVVLAPAKQLHAYSLSDAAKATAVFNTGDHSGTPPNLPFQMLFTTSDNTFTVPAGTAFYVPLLAIDNSPPVIGDFPSRPAQASAYFFGSSELGGHDFSIAVDNISTNIGPDYLVGPVTTQPLPDGGGTRYIVLAVFLGPLTTGEHSVTINTHLSGSAIIALFGTSIDFTTTYTVFVR
jgi:hypothetical protein